MQIKMRMSTGCQIFAYFDHDGKWYGQGGNVQYLNIAPHVTVPILTAASEHSCQYPVIIGTVTDNIQQDYVLPSSSDKKSLVG